VAVVLRTIRTSNAQSEVAGKDVGTVEKVQPPPTATGYEEKKLGYQLLLKLNEYCA
jgi:hypothetical protein